MQNTENNRGNRVKMSYYLMHYNGLKNSLNNRFIYNFLKLFVKEYGAVYLLKREQLKSIMLRISMSNGNVLDGPYFKLRHTCVRRQINTNKTPIMKLMDLYVDITKP